MTESEHMEQVKRKTLEEWRILGKLNHVTRSNLSNSPSVCPSCKDLVWESWWLVKVEEKEK